MKTQTLVNVPIDWRPRGVAGLAYDENAERRSWCVTSQPFDEVFASEDR